MTDELVEAATRVLIFWDSRDPPYFADPPNDMIEAFEWLRWAVAADKAALSAIIPAIADFQQNRKGKKRLNPPPETKP